MNALLKWIHVSTQTKALCNIEVTLEDHQKALLYITEAKKLFPKNQMIRLLEADSIHASGDIDGALGLCDTIISESEDTDGFPYVIKANIMASKVWNIKIYVRFI
jgi:hypothetical protein